MLSVRCLQRRSESGRSKTARIALVWSRATRATELQIEEVVKPPNTKNAAAVMTKGVREALCKAFAQKFGGRGGPSVRDGPLSHKPARWSPHRILDQRSDHPRKPKPSVEDAIGDNRDNSKITRDPVTNREGLAQTLKISVVSAVTPRPVSAGTSGEPSLRLRVQNHKVCTKGRQSTSPSAFGCIKKVCSFDWIVRRKRAQASSWWQRSEHRTFRSATDRR